MNQNFTEKQQVAAAKTFASRWQGRGYEKGETQTFWIEMLRDVFGVEQPTEHIVFEKQVRAASTQFIDAYIPSTRVLIEQKSVEKALISRDSATGNTPYGQALNYANKMVFSEKPHWIIVCNFAEFHIYDLDVSENIRKPYIFKLADLPRELKHLRMLTDGRSERQVREEEVSIKAGEIVAQIYSALRRQYADDSPRALRWLNILCVRMVFCLYAEDAGIFRRDQFHNYLADTPADDLREALLKLFSTLNTPVEKRSPYMKPSLVAFPYANGGLFAEEIEIPLFTEELKQTLLQNASLGFDWSDISPVIFGAIFEDTLSGEVRREGGMHYTSVANIHKVIDPLFLDGLEQELDTILSVRSVRQQRSSLEAFQHKLASLTFLDPACGSGNFLTETYLSLRRLENRVIQALYGEGLLGAVQNPVNVSIHQFHGIEINDFAVTVATTALWISEAQMLRETEKIVQHDIDFLPLKSYSNILEGNALRIDWPATDYIIGNPPFQGGMMMNRQQKQDMLDLFGKKMKGVGELDYVGAWYRRAAEIMQQKPTTRTAFVSTNSICQGEQATILWRPLFEEFGVNIDFAHRTFRWDSESTQKAHVHCVIIGFHAGKTCKPIIFDADQVIAASHINAYIMDAPDVWIDNRPRPICNVPPMVFGNMPRDGGGFILTQDERDALIAAEPLAAQWIHPFLGADEFLNNKPRYCLWLQGANPAELRRCPTVMARIERVRQMRLASSAASTRRMAETPTLFAQITQPIGHEFIIVPGVSSERRRYVPMGFMGKDIIASNLVFVVPDATLYHFGVLESSVHMAWMRAVCGRLKSDYRYSKDIVYNNFPWPEIEKIDSIEKTAQAILDARALFPEASLADLYDELTMPPELRRAHQANDRAVLTAYGFNNKMTEAEIVAELFKKYQKK